MVDDSVLSLKLCCRLFRQMGASVDAALNGLVAVDKMHSCLHTTPATTTHTIATANRPAPPLPAYDLVVMDYMMPLMNGPAACRRMREMSFTGLVVGLTGHAMPSDMECYLSHGADVVLKKPLDLQELRRVLLGCGFRGVHDNQVGGGRSGRASGEHPRGRDL